MVQLVPLPFDVLIGRMFRELEQKRSIFDLPAQRFVQAPAGLDLSLPFGERRASTPFGPAAGPHTQMAQNIALSWLAGGRVIEFKTVQVKDDIEVPRPCIDMANVGYNVEWSQELTVAQSLEEYVKGAMLIEMLKASGIGQGLGDTVFDISVGYDLAGIRSPKVRGFLDGLLDASAVVARLRAQIPEPWRAKFHDLPFPTRISDTLTLSTFHGCPPGEIEAIAMHLIADVGLDVVVKLNPTLLGRDGVDAILHERLGYHNIKVPDRAFAEDATWEQVVGMVERLGPFAAAHGRGFGVKFSNTLVVENHKTFFPASEKLMYLSGPPLHPLAIALVAKFRSAFGDRFPVSFSGGVDAVNFADTVALGLKPVTVCSDFLGPSGYRRGWAYVSDLAKRMNALGAGDLDVFTLKAHGQAEAALADLGLPADRQAACRDALAGGDVRAAAGEAFAAWVSAAKVRNSVVYAESAVGNARYGAAANAKGPKKVGSQLDLFDCLTCDKCIPLCPNDANFSYVLPTGETPIERLTREGGGWSVETVGALRIEKPRQIGTFADACNECGNCDVLCPEDGRPYRSKPLFFGGRDAFEAAADRDGFFVEPGPVMHGRFGGQVERIERLPGARVRYVGARFDLTLDPADVAGSVAGSAEAPLDLTRLRIMLALLSAVAAPEAANYVSAGLERAAVG